MAMLSATDRAGNTAAFWCTKCRPWALAELGVVWLLAVVVPATSMVPPGSPWYTPARILMRVDLPDPLPPSRAWIWPRATSKETSISARVPGKVLDR